MKNQYVGDINDYCKYGLLRILGRELKVGVCWMLTSNDGRSDGNKTKYLAKPERWRRFDSGLFDLLGPIVAQNRGVALVEQRNVIPGAVFHSDELVSEKQSRMRYFSEAFGRFENNSADIAFFDPDNGVRDRPGWSRRYVYHSELSDAFQRGYSVLVYQHFPRAPRELFIDRAAKTLQRVAGAEQIAIAIFRTAHVLFLLAVQDRHTDQVTRAMALVRTSWLGQIETLWHCHRQELKKEQGGPTDR
jgi:hypothetical protein